MAINYLLWFAGNSSTYSTDIKETKSETVSNDVFIEITIPRCTLSEKMSILFGSKKLVEDSSKKSS